MSIYKLIVGGTKYGISVACDDCKARAWYLQKFKEIYKPCRISQPPKDDFYGYSVIINDRVILKHRCKFCYRKRLKDFVYTSEIL